MRALNAWQALKADSSYIVWDACLTETFNDAPLLWGRALDFLDIAP